MKKKVLLTSIATIALCLCLIAGSTFALFTSQSQANIAVTAGKVNVVATIKKDSLLTWSLNETTARTDGSFANGGSADIKDTGELVIDRMTPGDVVQFTINVTNNSNVAIKYKVNATSTVNTENTVDLSDALVTTAEINGVTYTMNKSNKSAGMTEYAAAGVTNGVGDGITSITVTVTFPNGTAEHDNQYQNGTAKIVFTVEAVQSNGVPDTTSTNS